MSTQGRHPVSGRNLNEELRREICERMEAEELVLHRDGGWWCLSCQHVTEVDCDYLAQNVCGICHSPRITYKEPVKEVPSAECGVRNGEAGKVAPHPQLLPSRKSGVERVPPRVNGRRERYVSVPTAHMLFEKMRETIG